MNINSSNHEVIHSEQLCKHLQAFCPHVLFLYDKIDAGLDLTVPQENNNPRLSTATVSDSLKNNLYVSLKYDMQVKGLQVEINKCRHLHHH